MLRFVGFVLIVSSSASVGFSMADRVRRAQKLYRQALSSLAYMKAEIEFHLTPLDEITRQLSTLSSGVLGEIFSGFSRDITLAPGVSCGVLMRRCLRMQKYRLPQELSDILGELFDLLGRQDVLAQIRAIELAEGRLQQVYAQSRSEKNERCRAYRTIGICAGLALAIVLI